MLVHLDTDIGGDIDDLCALALLLRAPGIQINGVTTVAENGGRRAAIARYVLGLEERQDIPVAAGADNAGGYYPYELGLLDEKRYYPEPIPFSAEPLEAALELLQDSIVRGAVVIGIGPATNLALLERRCPGILSQAQVVLMGGYVFPTRPGYPQWGNDMDFNFQIDPASAKTVLEACSPTLVPLTVTVETSLRRAFLEDLRSAGALGRLIACQAEQFALDERHEQRFGATCAKLPRDTINFQHDPLTCAIAAGWTEGMDIHEIPVQVTIENGLLVERIHPAGKPLRVVTAVDGPGFSQRWLEIVARAPKG